MAYNLTQLQRAQLEQKINLVATEAARTQEELQSGVGAVTSEVAIHK